MPCRTYWALVEISASPGCKNALTLGKDFMKLFCRTCQELLGRNKAQPKKSCGTSCFLPLISLLGHLTWKDLRNRSVSLGFPEAQFPCCWGKVPTWLSPTARLSQQTHSPTKACWPTAQLFQRSVRFAVVVFCKRKMLAQDSWKLLCDFWSYSADLTYHKCKHCSQDLGWNPGSGFKYP